MTCRSVEGLEARWSYAHVADEALRSAANANATNPGYELGCCFEPTLGRLAFRVPPPALRYINLRT